MCDDTPAIIITRKILPGKSVWPILIANSLFIFYLCIGIVLNAFPLRCLIYKLRGTENPNLKTNFIWALLILFPTGVIAFLFPKIIDIISFLGGGCCVIFIVVFPGNLLRYNY